MLYVIGLGLKPGHLTLEGKNALQECKEVYLESYTSKYAEGSVQDLEKIAEKKIVSLERKEVEEEFGKVLEKAKEKDIALLVYGNVFSATTHIQILLDAEKKGIEVKSMPGISIMSFLGKTGLSEYKFGKTVSIVFWQENYKPESFYEKILENYKAGMHTLCLLDIQQEKLMTVREALELLGRIEKGKKHKFLDMCLFCALSRMGSESERIIFGKIDELMHEEETPAALIACAALDEKEKEAIKLWMN